MYSMPEPVEIEPANYSCPSGGSPDNNTYRKLIRRDELNPTEYLTKTNHMYRVGL